MHGNRINCTPTIIDLTVTWTGNGTIMSGTDNELIKAPGAVLNQHVNGKSALARPSGRSTAA